MESKTNSVASIYGLTMLAEIKFWLFLTLIYLAGQVRSGNFIKAQVSLVSTNVKY